MNKNKQFIVVITNKEGMYNSIFEIQADSEKSCIEQMLYQYFSEHIQFEMRNRAEVLLHVVRSFDDDEFDEETDTSPMDEYFNCDSACCQRKIIYTDDTTGTLVCRDITDDIRAILTDIYDEARKIIRQDKKDKRLAQYDILKKEFEPA